MSEKADVLTYWEDDVEFSVAGAPTHDITQPPPEPGVVWTLCEEDTTDPPLLGEVTVSREDRELALNAPTERRLERLVAALPGDLRASLGDVTHQQPDLPDVLPRLPPRPDGRPRRRGTSADGVGARPGTKPAPVRRYKSGRLDLAGSPTSGAGPLMLGSRANARRTSSRSWALGW